MKTEAERRTSSFRKDEDFTGTADISSILQEFASLKNWDDVYHRYEFSDGSSIVAEKSSGEWDYGIHREKIAEAQSEIDQLNDDRRWTHDRLRLAAWQVQISLSSDFQDRDGWGRGVSQDKQAYLEGLEAEIEAEFEKQEHHKMLSMVAQDRVNELRDLIHDVRDEIGIPIYE